MSFRRVASLDDLWSGEMKALEVDGKDILLINVDDHVYAYGNACPHQKSRLSEGRLMGTILRCARHHWEFDVSTGRGVNPKNARLRVFPVALESRDILVDVDAPEELLPAEQIANGYRENRDL
jgi:toluene monooxygenase system ferredoxin subunit